MRTGGGRASALLGLTLMATNPPTPGAFDRLPSEVREQATVVLTGRFQVGRGPCELLPDGSRRWPLLRGFRPTAVHRGDVATDYIGVTEARLLGSEDALVDGDEYLVALRPSRSSLKALQGRAAGRHPRHSLPPEEVLAIVALSGKPPEAQD